jgi:hypothetical protein
VAAGRGAALAAKVALVAAATAVVIGVAALGWAVAGSGSGGSGEQVAARTTSAGTSTPSPLASPAGIVPWVDSTPVPETTTPAQTPDPAVLAVPKCRGDQLQGAYTGSALEGGYSFNDFEIANVSPDPCRLSGEPTSFQYLGADGQSLFGGTQAKCNPQPCSQAMLAPNGAVDSASDAAGASRAVFRISGLNPAPGACGGATVVQSIALTMPGGGILTIPTSNANGCLGTNLGAFVPEVQTIVPPTVPPVVLITAAQVPSKAAVGQDMNFTIEITNVSNSAFSFGDICPNYELIIGDKAVDYTHNLNCHVVSEIAPGAHVLFAMKIAIPANLSPGNYDAIWTLDASYATPDTPSYPLTVIAP